MKYEIFDSGKWVTCKKAVVNEGWLHYEIGEGEIGRLGPSKKGTEWRQKPERSKNSPSKP